MYAAAAVDQAAGAGETVGRRQRNASCRIVVLEQEGFSLEDDSPRRGDVGEPEEEACLVAARDDVGDERPVHRDEGAEPGADEDPGRQRLRRQVGDAEGGGYRSHHGVGQPPIPGEEQDQHSRDGEDPAPDDQRLASDAVGEPGRGPGDQDREQQDQPHQAGGGVGRGPAVTVKEGIGEVEEGEALDADDPHQDQEP